MGDIIHIKRVEEKSVRGEKGNKDQIRWRGIKGN